MDKTNKLGKKLGRINKQARLNTSRVKENFASPNGIVGDFNAAFPFRQEFVAPGSNSATFMNLVIKDTPTPCSVNPPDLETYCSATIGGVNDACVSNLIATTSTLDPPNPDFVMVGSGVRVPKDGCYQVRLDTGVTSLNYQQGATINVVLTRSRPGSSSTTPVLSQQGLTGIVSILGPLIYCSASISPIYAVVTCMAGDILTASVWGSLDMGIPWVAGTRLVGWLHNFGSSFSITLVAVYEA